MKSTISEPAIGTFAQASPDIQSLAIQADKLDQAVAWWNNINLWVVGFGALIGVAIVASQFFAVTRGKQLSAAQASLNAAKDRQLASDLKLKDVSIAEANERALEAQKRTVEIENENLKILERISPRTIKDSQIIEFSYLRLLPSKIVRVESSPDNGESYFFAGRIIEILRSEGFLVQDQRGNVMGTLVIGINVRGNDLQLTNALRETFKRIGMTATDILDSGMQIRQVTSDDQRGSATPDATIFVGYRP